ncbi:hypothetical protein J6590_001577 [Homalodisca vitripennis]|nr:hypothetical protein J6590_001577 [Homalodisca vitripennis]
MSRGSRGRKRETAIVRALSSAAEMCTCRVDRGAQPSITDSVNRLTVLRPYYRTTPVVLPPRRAAPRLDSVVSRSRHTLRTQPRIWTDQLRVAKVPTRAYRVQHPGRKVARNSWQ